MALPKNKVRRGQIPNVVKFFYEVSGSRNKVAYTLQRTIRAYWASRLVAKAIKNTHTVVTVVEGPMQY
ncbi:hypothetical protein PC118_g16971 [Phytophthora cactorum]|uniref:Uncharacterized protein n=1 Tax=Phytophthora cactorum TaxID=29920 RepID=A0A8T1FCU2_9STRA|nr:hypothetical protein PC118_g16971 [Phytophthora cactorum]KAG3150374.1 hypothetical protein PC128_g23200 [Phytophthora cactorum]